MRRFLILAVLASLAGAYAVASSGVNPADAASLGRRVCKPPTYPGSTGRSLNLTTFHLSCSMGRKISLAHYHRRIRHGGATGYLKQNTKILGYKCFEQRLQNKTSYDGKVECKRGNEVSSYIYRQRGKTPNLPTPGQRP